jgi:hypothetical protein
MFWRIELDGKGKVTSCKRTAEKGKNGTTLIFLEAPTRATALSEADLWWRAQRAEKRAELRRFKKVHGLCAHCPGKGRKAVPGQKLCKPHLHNVRRHVRRRALVVAGKVPVVNDAEFKRVPLKDLRNILSKYRELGPRKFHAWLSSMVAKRSGLSPVNVYTYKKAA